MLIMQRFRKDFNYFVLIIGIKYNMSNGYLHQTSNLKHGYQIIKALKYEVDF